MKKWLSNEKLLIFGRWTSKVGNVIFDYANCSLLVSLFATNPLILGIYQASERIAIFIFNLIGGAVSDGNNKKKILIYTDLLSAIVCFIASLFVTSKMVAIALILANVFLAVVSSFNGPTYRSIVRELIHKDNINKYNSISNAGNEAIMVIGPTIGLFLVNIIGIRGALLFDAVTFLFSALSELFLVVMEEYKTNGNNNNQSSLWQRVVDGFKYLVSDKRIFGLIIISSLVNFFLAGYNLLVPYTNVMYDGSLSNFYSKVLVTEAIGGIAGSLMNSKFSSHIHDSKRTMKVFLFLISLFLFMIPIVSPAKNIVICLVPFFLCSCTMTIFNIQFMSYIQINVEHEYLGRVFSVITATAGVLMPLGSLLFSFVVKTSDIRSFYLVAAGIFVLAISNLFISDKTNNELIEMQK